MKNVSLTQYQVQVLENALIKYGNVVTVNQLTGLMSEHTTQHRRRLIKQMADAGWLVRIKRGLYQIADLSSLGMLTLSRYVIAQLLVEESYVSFESALQYHGLFDQLPATVASITLTQYPEVNLEGIHYRYIKTSDKYYFGWQDVQLDGRTCHIATPEKALIDLVQFHRTRLSVNLVAEKLAVYQHDLDIRKLKDFLLRSNLATLRIFGLLLDTLGVDTKDLWEFSRRSTTLSQLSRTSQLRNSRWQLVYDQEALLPITSNRETHPYQ